VRKGSLKARDLSRVELECLALYGSHFKMHPVPRPSRCWWPGASPATAPRCLGIEPGSSESIDAWRALLSGMTARGLRAPSLVISDGGASLIGAAELDFSHSVRQRCLIHRARNLLARVPKHAQAEVKAKFWTIWIGIEAEPGDAAVAEATKRAKAFPTKRGELYPAAICCLSDGFDHLTTYLALPKAHSGGSVTPTSSSAPSARPADGSR